MSPHDGMPKAVEWRETKAERKEQRRKIGRLGDQKVSPLTLQRYTGALRDLGRFAGLTIGRVLARTDMESFLASYIEHLWEEGESKTTASYTVAAVQFHQPQWKSQLREPWRLLSLWSKYEQPRRATPLSPQLLFAFCGVLEQWGWKRLSCLAVVAFCGLLRTGELFLLRRGHVALPNKAGQPAILFLEDTKTTQRNQLLWEKVLIYEEVALNCLRTLCRGLQPQDALADQSPQKFRALWKQVVAHLGLSAFNYLPYSLRRGGATAAYNNGTTLDQLLEKGRWKHIATARLYLDQALQEYTALSLPSQSQPLIRAAHKAFVTAGKGRVERGSWPT
eukprot:Skav208186  [mRNA]  locus=scaffold2530:390214:391218:+ [translate_table: standard]